MISSSKVIATQRVVEQSPMSLPGLKKRIHVKKGVIQPLQDAALPQICQMDKAD